VSVGRKPTVRACLDISIVHVPSALRDGIFDDADPEWGGMRVIDHEYGFILFLPTLEPKRGVPKWMRKIWKSAVKEEAMLINFDRDADEVKGWKTYD
jgi:hypothetical protein